MKEKFFNLEKEKRQRILTAAYDEFAEYSYQDASTNRIVKNAGIGKGMLFHYFGSKEQLFDFLVEYGYNAMKEHLWQYLQFTTGDFIERYRLMVEMKMKAYAEIGYMFHFFAKIFLIENVVTSKPNIVKEAMQVRQKVYENVDYSLFRDDIPPEEVMRIIRWAVEGYEKELTDRYKLYGMNAQSSKGFKEELATIENLLARLRQVFYKQKEEC